MQAAEDVEVGVAEIRRRSKTRLHATASLRSAVREPPTSIRPAREVAQRFLVLAAVSQAAHEQPPSGARDWLSQHDLHGALTEWERDFLSHDRAPHDLLVAASWRLEACAVLSWALNVISTLPPAVEQISWEAAGIAPALFLDPQSFIAKSSLRPDDELSAMQSDIQSQHWGVRAGPAGRRLFSHPESEENLHPFIVYQRHYAVNWVMGHGDDWDHVPTDT
jgi:hypothetical protein